MFLGLRTAVYYVSDIEAAKKFYSAILGVAPYFDQPFYVGYNVGGFELGLQPEDDSPRVKGNAHLAYWGVDDAESALKQVLELGATENEAIQDVGGGIKVASVKDPFGMYLGLLRIRTLGNKSKPQRRRDAEDEQRKDEC